MTIVIQKAGATGGGGGSGPVLQPVGTIATRPGGLDGALQTFVETTKDNSIRSQGDDNQVIKVRRRATHVVRTADASVTVTADKVQLYKDWYEICQSGVLPTRFRIPPSCAIEEVWRMAAPPSYDWSVDGAARACRIMLKLEQLPHWKGV